MKQNVYKQDEKQLSWLECGTTPWQAEYKN